MQDHLLPIAQQGDQRPLPLLVAEIWDFPLASHEIDGELWYAVQDWIRGLIGGDSEKLATTWGNMQRSAKFETLFSKQSLPYTATDGKTYKRDFTTDKGLYLIAQNLRSTKERPQLAEIKNYLAKAGVFVDKVRRKPEELVQALADNDPDALLDAAIQAYTRRGKDIVWIRARLMGKISRNLFTAALQAAIIDITKQHFALATDEIYDGLWGRTAAGLKREMNIPPNKSLRDNQPTLALYYQGIAEEISAKHLGERQRLSWQEARNIVRSVADIIGVQAAQTSQLMNMDLATGKPFLPG